MIILKYWKELSIGTVFIILFYSGYYVRGLIEISNHQKDITEQISAVNQQSLYNSKIANDYEIRIAKLNDNKELLQQQLETVYAETAYKCVLPNDGLLLINKARRN